jgi:hypothetical protein
MGTGIGGIRVQDQLFMLDPRGYTPTLGSEPLTPNTLPRTTTTTPKLPTTPTPAPTPAKPENPAARANHPLGGPPGLMKKKDKDKDKEKDTPPVSPTQGFNAALAQQGAKPAGGIAPTAPPPNPLSTAIKTNTDALTSSVSRVFA